MYLYKIFEKGEVYQMRHVKEIIVGDSRELIYHQTPAVALCEKEIVERVTHFLSSDENFISDSKNKQRDKKIYLAWLYHGKYVTVGRIHKLSTDRVRHICKRITTVIKGILIREGMIESY